MANLTSSVYIQIAIQLAPVFFIQPLFDIKERIVSGKIVTRSKGYIYHMKNHNYAFCELYEWVR